MYHITDKSVHNIQNKQIFKPTPISFFLTVKRGHVQLIG